MGPSVSPSRLKRNHDVTRSSSAMFIGDGEGSEGGASDVPYDPTQNSLTIAGGTLVAPSFFFFYPCGQAWGVALKCFFKGNVLFTKENMLPRPGGFWSVRAHRERPPRPPELSLGLPRRPTPCHAAFDSASRVLP